MPQAPVLSGARPRFSPTMALWLVIAAWVAVAGCTSQSLDQGPGGLAPNIADRITLIVAQTRAQRPERSGMDIPFQARNASEAGQEAPPELALEGKGIGVQPGLQPESPSTIQLALFLDKARYARGYVKLGFNDQPEEQWPIVAYDRRGDPTESFEHSYALVTPQGLLRYLVVIGGYYEQEDRRYQGFEGTLVVPGKDYDPETWQEAYKIDFGYRFPAEPDHEALVKEADTIYKALGRKGDLLDRLQRDIAKMEGELAAQQVRPPTTVSAADHQAAIERTQQRMEELRGRFNQALAETKADFLRYYQLRKDIAQGFQAYLDTNHYHWRTRKAQQAIFDRWKVVEYHHPRIDELFYRFLRNVTEDSELLEARKTAMELITRINNWDRDPARAGASPRPAPE